MKTFSRLLERQEGMVQIVAQVALGVAEKAECVLLLGLLAIGIREEVISLRPRCDTLRKHTMFWKRTPVHCESAKPLF